MKRWIRLGAALALGWLAGPAVAGQPEVQISVDQAFEQLKAYDYGQSRRPLAMLELAVARATADPQRGRRMAERLAAVLTDAKATLAAKRFVCQWLPLVASDAQVAVLVKMLDAAETADMARRALQAIPGEASAGALREALGRTQGKTLVGVVNSLGARRDAGAAAALAGLLRAPDKAVSAAAATALGQIGGQEAMAALEKAEEGADAALLECLRDAQLRAAACAGAGPAALRLYKRLGDETMPTRWRLAAMSGAIRVCGQAAWPMIRQALASDDGVLRGAAAALLQQTPPKIPTSILARELTGGDPKARPLLIGALAERADPAAKDAVAAFIDSEDEALRVAVVHAVSRMGGAGDVGPLLRLASGERGPVQQAARVGLERLAGDGVEARLIAAAAQGEAARRTEAVAAIAARRSAGASPVLIKAAGDRDETLRRAALEALAAVGDAAAYPKLVGWLASPVTPGGVAAIEKAAAAVGARIEDEAKRVGPVAEALRDAPSGAKPSLLRLLGACGGTGALAALRPHLADPDAAVRDAAVRVLADWPDLSASNDVLAVAKDSDNRTHRVLAVRGYLRLMKQGPDAAARQRMMTLIRPIATTADARKMLLAALADVPGPGALEMAKSFLDDPKVKAEAELAVRKITGAMKPKRGGGAAGAAVPAYDKQRSDALKKELAGRAPNGCRLTCYLDCGPDTSDGAKDGPALRLVSGAAHLWPGADRDAHIRFGTVAFDGREVLFEAAGLDPKRSYHVGFTWWDYDHDTRAQSVWAAGKAGPFTRLLDKTDLPAGRVRSEKPAEKTLPIPRTFSAGGTVRIACRNDAAPNAVVSELWLWESRAEGPPPAAANEKPQPNSSPPMPQVKASAKAGKAAARLLIVTGIDYPGHKWRETTPVLKEAIEKDPRLAVDVVEDPNFLASPGIHDYAAIVHHWMNWKTDAPGAAARENFRKFVAGGKGLVVVHFGCGAFQDWPEFVKIAGRVWDPKLRGHDPRGPFRVEITDVRHPITQGMKPFETVDELYTCLTGDVPIDVLATAQSKVDKKVYPIAFVLTCGKGRVFHSVLGHDVKAFSAPEVGELFRRASAWAAGLPPAAEGR